MNKPIRPSRFLILSLSLAAAFSASSVYAENVKIAFIDPLSGTFAPIGQNQLKSFQMLAETANQQHWAGDNTLEFVGFDNKGSPQESLTQLKNAIDQGFHYITQGNGSGAGLALIDAINKNNERNPGHEIVYLNHAAVDPDMTNSKCSFWHFRFDANSDMKMEALTTFMAKDKGIKKVYIIGQNYSFGQQVSRAAKEYLKRKRPDVEVVGDDFHPIATVKDFSPYVAKIKASGADTVITGNWGADLALLIKAAKDADLNVNFYTYYGATTGVPTAMGASGADKVFYVGYWNANNDGFVGHDVVDEFQEEIQRRLLRDGDLHGRRNADQGDQGQASRPTRSRWRMPLEGMKVKRFERRSRNAQIRPSAAAAALHRYLGQDRRQDREV